MTLFTQVTLLLIAYLFGSIPWGFVLGKMKGIDIREYGSKNIGATNTGRVLGRRYAVLAYFLDAFKGFIFVGLFTSEILNMKYCLLTPMLYGLAAVLGHTFPIYLKFKGGKAVATGGGVLLAFSPLVFIVGVGVFFLVTYVFKYVCLISSIFLSIFYPDKYNLYYPIGMSIIFTIILIRHKTNISRIIHKNESKVKWRKEKSNKLD
jgi:glycerol-3-phosphate acyltransferase PlsY